MIGRVAIAGALLALVVALFAFKASAKMPDFEVYWRAGERAAAAEPLYRDEDEHYQLKYLPAFAILAMPAAHLPLPVAKAVWFGMSVALVCGLLALSLTLVPVRKKPAWMLVTITLVVMAKFYGHELVLGQVNLLLASIVLLAVHASLGGRPIPAGLLVALAVVIKPYAVIFVPWLAVRRDIFALASAAVGIACALLLPMVVYGIGGTVGLHHAWWTTVTESTAPNLLNADNVSLAAMYAKWLGPHQAAAWLAVTTGALILLAAGVMFAVRRRVRSPDGLEASLLLTLIPLLSPQGWDYVFLVSTPAIMYLLNYERDLPGPIRVGTIAALATIAFSLYDVMGRRAYAAFMMLSVISVCYLVLIASMLTLRLRRIA
ncbi:MAG: glycosyltransferase family 87 protein [Vicinamibacterales bacterium]